MLPFDPHVGWAAATPKLPPLVHHFVVILLLRNTTFLGSFAAVGFGFAPA